MLGKNSQSNHIHFIKVVLVIIFLIIMWKIILTSLNLVAETINNNLQYTIKIRNSIEELDSIVERAEVNIGAFTDTILQTYDTTKLYDVAYNRDYLKKIDILVKAALINSSGISGTWFQLNVDVPFANKFYIWYGLDKGKIVKYTQFNTRTLSPKDDIYYFEAVKNKTTTWSNIYTDKDTKESMMSISQPIIKNGKLIGVIGIDITIEKLQHALRKMQLAFPSSEIFLLDKNKKVIVS